MTLQTTRETCHSKQIKNKRTQRHSSKQGTHHPNIQANSSPADIQEDIDPHDPTKLSCSKKAAAVRKHKTLDADPCPIHDHPHAWGAACHPNHQGEFNQKNSVTMIKPKRTTVPRTQTNPLRTLQFNRLRKSQATRKINPLMDLSSTRMTIQPIQLALSLHPIAFKRSELMERSIACCMNDLSRMEQMKSHFHDSHFNDRHLEV
jgi:hypothetical protein